MSPLEGVSGPSRACFEGAGAAALVLGVGGRSTLGKTVEGMFRKGFPGYSEAENLRL